jgi:hypothetical protein
MVTFLQCRYQQALNNLITNNLNFIIMKKVFFFIAFLFVSITSFAQSSVYVSGYTKSNGTYVEPYFRTSPNSTRNDNYSTVGNVNPYTGTSGTKPADSYYSSPSTYSSPSYSSPSYSSPSYSIPTYSSPTYSSPSYATPSSSNSIYSNPVYVGPRGGQYYINSNGNKTYIRN